MSTNLTQGSSVNFSCTEGRMSGATVPDGISVGQVAYWPARNPGSNATRPQDTFEWKALAPCCESRQNVTKEEDDCVLWCELPRDTFPPNPSHNPPREGSYSTRFSDCVKKNLPKDFDGLLTMVHYPNNANKTGNGSNKPSSTPSSTPSPTPSSTPSSSPSPSGEAAEGGQSDKSAALAVLKMPNVLTLGLVTVMAGVYTILS
ncbi:hypothetical protein PG987_000791 [Apiospora arundinis]